MASGGELAFVTLRLIVKFLDNVFFVLGKGLLATLLTVAASILRLVLGRDASRGSDASTARVAAAAAARAAAACSRPPRRVLEASNGDSKKLRDKHLAWLSWRREYDVDAIFATPKPAYACVKSYYPHAFHGVTRDGFAVQLEMPGQFPRLLDELRRRGHDDPTRAVVEHVSFIMCHAFDRLDAREFPRGRILRVVDMSRLDASDTTYEAFTFLKAMANLSSAAFPERIHKVIIVNPPAVFGVLWSVFSPMVSAKTLARVRICRDADEARDALLEDLDLDDIPREYGGKCQCGRGRGRGRARGRGSGTGSGTGEEPTPSERLSGCWRNHPSEEDARRRAEELNGEDEEDAYQDRDADRGGAGTEREREREREKAARRARRKKGSSERERRAAGPKRASTKRMVTLDGRGGLDGELVRVGGGSGGGGAPPPRESSEPSEGGEDDASEGSWSFW